jgi:hypothetical protein
VPEGSRNSIGIDHDLRLFCFCFFRHVFSTLGLGEPEEVRKNVKELTVQAGLYDTQNRTARPLVGK